MAFGSAVKHAVAREHLTAQARAVFVSMVDNRAKHLAALMVMGGLCAVAGVPTASILVHFAIIGLCEVAADAAGRALVRASRIWLVAMIWLTAMIATPVYMHLGVLLTEQGNLALVIIGLIANVGILSQVAMAFTSQPIFNMAQTLPAIGLVFYQVHQIAGRDWPDTSDRSWLGLYLVMGFFVLNLLENLAHARRTTRQLITAQKQADARSRELETLAQRDTLTGLLSRCAFDRALVKRLAPGKAFRPCAVLIADLNGFKPINDSYSHEAGDALLRTLGQRLIETTPPGTLVARLGGDEFVIVCDIEDVPKDPTEVGQSIMDTIARPVEWQGKLLSVTASVGVAVATRAGMQGPTLCARADQAMYHAKTNRLDTPVLYTTGQFRHRPTLQERSELHDAILRNEIRPFYQPKVDLRTGRIIGFEALARWTHPDGRIGPPSEFMPLIEELGLQGEFLSHFSRHVVSDVLCWLGEGLDPGQVSVNLPEVALATISVQRDLIELFEHAGDARAHLTLEITEDVFIARAGGLIREAIARLRATGLLVSLDDFGTGFASFKHLRDLEFDELKIDTSFTADLGEDPAAEVLIAGLMSIAQGLRVQVIAEGVETEEQRAHLLRLGCSLGQGYLWDAALPPHEAVARLRTQPYLYAYSDAVSFSSAG